MDFDLVVANGTIVDGTGAPGFRGDIGIRAGFIEAVSRGERLHGRRIIDATGLVVAPGFVDMDSHVDWAVVQPGARQALARWLRQGVTSVIGGACGFSAAPVRPGCEDVVSGLGHFLAGERIAPSWHSMAELMEWVEKPGLPLNVGFLVGQNTLRAQAGGDPHRPAKPDALRWMLEETREALRAGALGLSVNAGFVPGAFASDAEVTALAELVAAEGGVLAVHARAYTRLSAAWRSPFGGPHNVRALRELVDLARRTRVRLHVLHLMVVGRRTWGTHREALRCIDEAAADGVDIAFDASPYTVSVGPLQLVFPPAFAATLEAGGGRPSAVRRLKAMALLQRALVGIQPDDLRLRSAGAEPTFAPLAGLSFTELAGRLGMHSIESQVELARRVGLNGASVMVGTCSGDQGDERALRAILAHPRCAFGTNAAAARTDPQNPSAVGAFPRVLGRYVRELGLIPLEEAVRRMTSWPATCAGLTRHGRVTETYWADLTMFDPATVGDAADPERGDAVPPGIRRVLVSGVPVVEDGAVDGDALPGRLLRKQTA